MKRPNLIPGVFLLFSTILLSCNSHNSASENSSSVSENAETQLRAANDKFYAALNAMFTGELEPMNSIWSHGEDVTDMGPFGGCLVGWTAVGEEFKKEAGMKLGGKVLCKDLIVHAGSEMGYSVCTEEGENMSADGKPVVVKFRATNIFRLENGEWKMVHHHTDMSSPLQEATSIDVN